MSAVWPVLSLLAAGYALYSWGRYLRQRPYIHRLCQEEIQGPESHSSEAFPLLSVIIAARNEEASIRSTLLHLVRQQQEGMPYELIVVNDRSADQTADVLDAFLAKELPTGGPSLRVITIKELPPGWLGKNYALYQGYREARGELLLFADADIGFGPGVLRDALRLRQREQAEHVTLIPFMKAGSWPLRLFVRFFLFSLSLIIEPWLANDDRERKRSMGVGAFNLITRRAYEQIGTHKAWAYRPDDDLRLGRRVKEAGLRQRLAAAGTRLDVEWYPSLKAAFSGLEKNLFSGLHYSYTLAILAVLGQLAVFVVPLLYLIGCWLFSWNGFPFSWITALYAMSYLLICALYAAVSGPLLGRPFGRMLPESFLHPLGSLLLVYVMIRTVLLTAWRGGVYWRGTFYPLKELRRTR